MPSYLKTIAMGMCPCVHRNHRERERKKGKIHERMLNG